MPIYDFECTLCRKVFEKIVSSDINEVNCPDCNADSIKIFKGTHFIPFKPYVEYNFGNEPVEIKSKKHLENELKSRGLSMDNRSIGLKSSKTKRSELKNKAKKAKEFLNATS